jgi:hypothetical protein
MSNAAADALHCGEDMSADWTIGILDRDGTLQDGLKGLPDIGELRLSADEHRYRLEFACRLTRRLGCCDSHLFCFDGGFASRRRGIELRLEFGFSGGDLGLEFGDTRVCLCLAVLGSLLGFG